MPREPGRHQDTVRGSQDSFCIPRICGSAGRAGDIALVTTVITGVALCLGCIAEKTGVPHDEIKPLLDTIEKAVEITNSTASCDACRNMRNVFRLA